ncbi:MAG TPA: hypothetical protein PKX08_19385 [Cyclobacteriaceae bacterium]|nr:hypothetical protein [Cyclobacteriaceae bacterium]
MSNPTPQDVYDAVRNLLPELDETMRTSVQTLLVRADMGEKVDNLIIDLIAENPAVRKKMREVLYFEDDLLTTRDFSGLAGNPSSPAAEKYMCPKNGCAHTIRIQKAGEDPGKCPEHGIPLVPFKNKRGK